MIFGKLLGGLFGFSWLGILGAILGVYIGHQFDKGLARNMGGAGSSWAGGQSRANQAKVQQAFFRLTFLTMGRLAKADGRVSEDEIKWAEFVMARLNLNPDMRKEAMRLFAQGKDSAFNLDAELDDFRGVVGRHAMLLQMFLEIQIQAAYADGDMSANEGQLLQHVCQRLGISKLRFQTIHQRIRAERAFADRDYQNFGGGQTQYTPAQKLQEAYQVLGVNSNATDTELKKAYRRLMSQHHPDKLVAKGLPEEMMKLAKEKTQEIQAAYDLIKQQRKNQ